MDRNLGALDDKSSQGRYYQFGRKDPFNPNISYWTYDVESFFPSHENGGFKKILINDIATQYNTNNKNVPFSVNHPDCFIYDPSFRAEYGYWTTGDIFQLDGNCNKHPWGDPKFNLKIENEEVGKYPDKSLFDPCPLGWKMLSTGWAKGFIGDSNGSATANKKVNFQWNVENDSNGRHRGSSGRTYFPLGYLNEKNNPNPQTAFFYFAGQIHCSSGKIFSSGNYVSMFPSGKYKTNILYFTSSNFIQSGYSSFADGNPIRCVKE